MLRNKHNNNIIRLIVCDGDGTIVSYPGSPSKSTWDMIGHIYCNRREWDDNAAKYLEETRQSKIKTEQDRLLMEWALKDAEMLKGKPAKDMYDIDIPYTEGAKEYFLSIKNGVKKAIISGGLDIIIGRAATELGFNDYSANTLGTDEQGLFDGKIRLLVKDTNKEAHLMKLLAKYQISASQTLVIGDGHNDIPMFQCVRRFGGLSIAINPATPQVREAANYTITNFLQLHQYIEETER